MHPKTIISVAVSLNPSSLIDVDEWFGHPSQKVKETKGTLVIPIQKFWLCITSTVQLP